MDTTTLEAPVKEPHPPSEPAGSAAPVAVSSLRFRHGSLEVIRALELEVPAGGVVGLVGPSGCGKSTFLELVAGLRDPGAGSIEVAGRGDAAGRLASCAFMPQRDLLLPWLSAADNAALSFRTRGMGRREARAAAAPLLETFGLGGFEHVRPTELSGGMRQRVAFARTLLSGKPVLLLDEPFGGLDAITRGEMQEWLAEALARERRTAILVTHDVEEALYLCDRVAVLSARPARIVADLGVEKPRFTPRSAAVTAPEFVSRRERALEALAEGSR
jgi:NitT/TauT family transport system ATP-binding protein